MTPAQARRILYLVFFLSGACSLIYQIVWTRMMQLVFGVSVFAVSAVLCSFMAGLALGNFFFGRLSDRVRRPLFAYGLTELGIASLALAFPLFMNLAEPVFVWAHHRFYGPGPDTYYFFSFVRFLIIFPILLAPTFLMGGTLPLIARHFIRSDRTVGAKLGLLYGLNTTGAVVGTFFAGFVLIERLGSTNALVFAGLVNVAIGAATTWIGRAYPDAGLEPEPEAAPEAGRAGEGAAESDRPRKRKGKGKAEPDRSPPARPAEPEPASLPAWIVPLTFAAAGLSGFVSLALQVLWTRVLVYYTSNSTYAYSAMLTVFLTGLALGGWATGLLARRIRRPLFWLACAVAGIGLWALASLQVLDSMYRITKVSAETLALPGWYRILAILFAQATAMLFVPTLLMGATLPLAVQIVARGRGSIGSRIGDVYGWNTLGTVLGSFSAGFLLIPLIYIRNSFVLAAAIDLALAVALIFPEPSVGRVFKTGFALAAGAVLLAAERTIPATIVVDQFTKYSSNPSKLLFYAEDITDTIMVWDPLNPDGTPNYERRDVFFADGRANGGHRTRVEDHFYGHLPMLLHEKPEKVLSIGVCSGNTIGAITRHARLKKLDAVELSEGVIDACAYIETNYGVFSDNRDPRLTLHVEDGRNFLLGTKEKYDVININPPYVHTAGVIFLYTREFYELCRARLNPGGMVSHFIEPGQLGAEEQRMLVATFAEAFPHVTLWHGPRLYSWNLVGSDRPIRIDLPRIEKIVASEPQLKQSLVEDKLDEPMYFFSLLLMKDESVREYVRGAKIVTDDKTILDFTAPRERYSGFGFFQVMPGAHPDTSQFIQFAPEGIFVRAPDEVGLDGGYASVGRLNARSDLALDLIEWGDVEPAEREKLEAEMRHYVDLRRKAVNILYSLARIRDGSL